MAMTEHNKTFRINFTAFVLGLLLALRRHNRYLTLTASGYQQDGKRGVADGFWNMGKSNDDRIKELEEIQQEMKDYPYTQGMLESGGKETLWNMYGAARDQHVMSQNEAMMQAARSMHAGRAWRIGRLLEYLEIEKQELARCLREPGYTKEQRERFLKEMLELGADPEGIIVSSNNYIPVPQSEQLRRLDVTSLTYFEGLVREMEEWKKAGPLSKLDERMLENAKKNVADIKARLEG